MSLIITLLNETPFVLLPGDWLGWVVLGLWLAGLGAALFGLRGYQKTGSKRRWLYLVLLLITPPASLFLGIRLPAGNALPPPGLPMEPQGLAWMVFSALPWVLAGGLLGPLAAASLAAVSAGVLAYWDTHSPFLIVELSLLALLFSVAVNQRYRTWGYRLWRQPFFTALALSLFYPVFYIFNMAFAASGSLAARLDFAITQAGTAAIAAGGPLWIAGLVAQLARLAFPSAWGGQAPWLPSPAERRLQARLNFVMAPLGFVFVLILIIGDWLVAGQAAREMLKGRMAGAVEAVVEDVPFFLSAGQSLIMQFAGDTRLELQSPETLAGVLASQMHSIPYFRLLFILNAEGLPVAGYPESAFSDVIVAPAEQAGYKLALEGVPIQVYTLAPADGEASAQVTFLARIGTDEAQGVLIGRADLATNPLAQSILVGLNSMSALGGDGYLLDEDGRILYHHDPNRLMMSYPVQDSEQALFYDDTAPDGTRQLVYSQPASGRPWTVVLTVPARSAQQLALNIAAPLLGLVVVLSIVIYALMQGALGRVTASLRSLAEQAGRIARGDLDSAIAANGEDENAQLRRAFEQMRVSLKARLAEQERLLKVSQDVTGSLEMEASIRPILEAAVITGDSIARLVLAPGLLPDMSLSDAPATHFEHGLRPELYAYLDDQILHLMHDQERIVLSNPARASLLAFEPGAQRPESLIAFALRHEEQYYGALWLGYNQPHTFADEEVNFLETLAGQASLAVANAALFLAAEVGRQRLAAILASTPDPVLVTDHRDRLLLLNPAAWQVLALGSETGIGKPVQEVIAQTALARLLCSKANEKESLEVPLADGKIYLATASPIKAEVQSIGRVCILRDITHFKALDALKSEFVSTVSHDLRSPLTLMRGYATMLEMVGDLNEQQARYVSKIVVGVESMSRLVNSLLDLGRIEAEIGLHLEMISALDIVERVTESLSLQAAQKRIDLATELTDEGLPLLEADQALLQQALHNLIENAIKYTPTGGMVRVFVRSRDEKIIFEIHDTGIGISPIDLPRLFEKFYRSTSREAKREKGTGLGLAIVKSIAERHHGRAWVESQLGKGSKFYLSIPVRQPRR